MIQRVVVGEDLLCLRTQSIVSSCTVASIPPATRSILSVSSSGADMVVLPPRACERRSRPSPLPPVPRRCAPYLSYYRQNVGRAVVVAVCSHTQVDLLREGVCLVRSGEREDGIGQREGRVREDVGLSLGHGELKGEVGGRRRGMVGDQSLEAGKWDVRLASEWSPWRRLQR